MMQSIGAQGYQQTPSASAVNIQIFEPKAFAQPMPGQVQNPVYNYPQQSMYCTPCQNPYQQYIPQQQVYSPVPQYQQIPEYQQQQPVQAQPMPAPVLADNNQIAQNQIAPEQQAVQPMADAQAPQEQAQVQPDGVDVNALIAGLQSQDNKAQEDAITAIANLSQGDPAKQSAVLTEPVMNALASIAAQDTSGLQGPTDAQVAAINKAATGAELTPEEQQLTQNLAPKTAADKNKVISMFTLAMLQKNQRDEIDKYNETQPENAKLPQLKASDLIGYNAIENAARNANDKEVQLAAIQALSYIARPEDKEILEPVLNSAAQSSQEPLIKQAASEVLANLSGAAAPQAPQGEAEAKIEPQKENKK